MDSSQSPAPPVGLAEPPTEKQFPLEFRGSGSEYFRIWIVNISLTVLTLGIYSAWAKVRKMQYFYGNSHLAGGAFEYTASPLSILKGRVLVFFAIVAYQVAAHFQPVLALVILLLLVPVIPWIVIKALDFNLRYSSYRGLNFRFDGRYWEAFRVYVLLTLAIPLSMGFAYPYVAWRRKQFFIDNARYGRSPFSFSGSIGHFYTVYVVGYLVLTGLILVAMLLFALGIYVATEFGVDVDNLSSDDAAVSEETLAIAFSVAGIVAYVGFLLSFLVLNTGIQALIANHVWERTKIPAAVSFHLDLNLWKVIGIQVTNILAIIFSLGLLIPWASVRMMRYKASRFTMIAAPSTLESFIANEQQAISATGTELGDALELDLGI